MARTKLAKNLTRVALMPLIALAGNARAAERWAALGSEATAQLPPPTRAEAIVDGRLMCAEKRWHLVLLLSPGTAGGDGSRKANLRIGAEKFELDANRQKLAISVDIPTDALPPMRAGLRMDVSVTGGPTDHQARFSLAGSRRTIEEISPRCSNRDMSAYDAVTPGELNPETVLARELLTNEIKAFRAVTKSAPSVAAAMRHVGGDRRLLFATLCGSSWYYGNSGCNMTVHAQEDNGEWKRVYETEGVSMHIDPNAQSGGWPNLVALTFDGDEVVWRWMDGGYQPPIEEELRGG